MKPLDPRLLKHARQTAVYIAVLVALGAAAAGLIIAQAQLLSGARRHPDVAEPAFPPRAR